MKRTIFYLIICSLVFLSIFYFKEIAQFLFPSNADKTGELIKLILSIIGGICIIYGLYISNRRARATERSVWIQSEQIKLSLKSQIDERFKSAIEHLGSDKEPIILGGIAELHQIAKENSDKYTEVVFNILCSYIRTGTSIYEKKADDIITPTAISTIINYLFKNTEDNPYKLYSANLSTSNLSGQDIDNCYLKDANLSQCRFHTINNSFLDGANFTGSEIFGMSFQNNSWRGVNLFHVKMTSVTLNNVDFSSSIVKEERNLFAPLCFNCRFENVIFDNISVFGAFFIGCIFINCSFKNATIGDSSFYCCSFEDVSIFESNLLSKINFSASVFWNFHIGYSMMDFVLKGCSIEKTFNIYIPIEQHLDKQKRIESTADKLNFPSTLPSNYIFGKLSDTECQEILNKYKELKEMKKLPVKSDTQEEKQTEKLM